MKFKLVPDKPYIPKEYDEQVLVFEWLKDCELPGADMAYATLNGVRLSIGLAKKMKRAGLCSGPPDINVDVARHGYHGLRIEVKRVKGGVLSDDQKKWHKRLTREGYRVRVAKGHKEVIEEITWYLT